SRATRAASRSHRLGEARLRRPVDRGRRALSGRLLRAPSAMAPVDQALDAFHRGALLVLEDAFGVLRERERAEAEQDVLPPAGDAELVEDLGEQGKREPGRDRTLEGAGTDGDEEDDPEQPEEGGEVRGVVRLVVEHGQQTTAETGDAGRQRERDDPPP